MSLIGNIKVDYKPGYELEVRGSWENPKTVAVLHNKYGVLSAYNSLTNSERFILTRCPLTKYARNTKKHKVLAFIVAQLNKNNGQKLSCETIKENLDNLITGIPLELTCEECKYNIPFKKEK